MEPEIPRMVEVAALDPLQIEAITRTVFVPHAPRPAEVLFVFGTVQADWDGLAAHILAGWYPRVVVAGRMGPTFTAIGKPIAEAMADELALRGVPRDQLLLQTTSDNTLTDVVESLAWISGASSLTFAAKSHHSGRCQRTLRRFLPVAELFAHTHIASMGDVLIHPETWHLNERAISMVLGEFQRIELYSGRRDIASSP